MKKISIIILLLFFVNMTPVKAYDSMGVQVTCAYKAEKMESAANGVPFYKYFDIMFYGGSYVTNIGKMNYYERNIYNSKSNIFSTSEGDIVTLKEEVLNRRIWYLNWSEYITGLSSDAAENDKYQYNTQTIVYTQKEDAYNSTDPEDVICPTKVFILKHTIGTKKTANAIAYDIYGCGINHNNVDTCSVTENMLQKLVKTSNHDGTAGTLNAFDYYTGIGNTNKGTEDLNIYNVEDSYIEAEQKKEETCDENTSTYNKEECEKANMESEMAVEQGENQGTTEVNLEQAYKNYKAYNQNQDYDYVENAACDSLFGRIDNANDPAYYINFAFNLMKYLAIILLVVLTIMDFAKAVTSSKDDAIKKASMNAVKRIIIAVVIFFLPTLINFIFEFLGWVTDPTCGIGG